MSILNPTLCRGLKGQPCLLVCTWSWPAKPVCYYTVNLSVAPQWLIFFSDGEIPGRPVNHTSISLGVKDSRRVSESSWQSETFSSS